MDTTSRSKEIESNPTVYPIGYPEVAIMIRERFCERRFKHNRLPGDWRHAIVATTRLKGVMKYPHNDPDGLRFETCLRWVHRFDVKTGFFC